MTQELAAENLIDGMVLAPLRRISIPSGDVLHALKSSEAAFHGFGEAYFTTVGFGEIKGWKRHQRMISNLIVPVGMVKLKFFDDRPSSRTNGKWLELTLGTSNYQRVTVPPGLWFGFQGADPGLNLMLNLASIEHDPTETDSLPLDHEEFSKSGW